MPYTISLSLLATGTLKVSYCSNFDELCAVYYPYRDTMCEEATGSKQHTPVKYTLPPKSIIARQFIGFTFQ